MKTFIAAFLLAMIFSAPAHAELTKNDLKEIRLIVQEEIAHVDKRLQDFREDTNSKFQEQKEDMDRRFLAQKEVMDRRFQEQKDDMDRRFQEIRGDTDKRFEQMMSFMWILASIFTALVVLVISFALWDRRTMVRPFEKKVEEIEGKIREINDVKLKNLISTFRELAKADNKVATALRNFNLL